MQQALFRRFPSRRSSVGRFSPSRARRRDYSLGAGSRHPPSPAARSPSLGRTPSSPAGAAAGTTAAAAMSGSKRSSGQKVSLPPLVASGGGGCGEAGGKEENGGDDDDDVDDDADSDVSEDALVRDEGKI